MPIKKKSKLKNNKIATKKKMVRKPKLQAAKKKKTAAPKSKVAPIPKGYHSITAYLMVDDAKAALKFYKKAFAAKEKMRMEQPDRKIAHAEIKIGDTKIMLADECPEQKYYGPKHYSGTPVGLHLYVKKVDEVVKKAVSSGAKLLRPVENMFYGDRTGTVVDPFGHLWTIASQIEKVTPAKLRKRAKEVFANK